MTFAILSLCVVAGFLCVFLEEKLHFSKAKAVLLFGTLAWLIVFVRATEFGGLEHVREAFFENILDISTLWLFLFATMTFVAFLNKKGVVESVVQSLLPRQLSERGFLFVCAMFAYGFSALADNVTATLVTLALVASARLAPQKNIRFAVMVVFAVNSGGVALITGDVTTLMVFLAQKLTVVQLLVLGLPSFAGVAVLFLLLSRGLEGEIRFATTKREVARVDQVVGVIFFTTIGVTIAGSLVWSIPPLLTFLFGMSLMFLVGWLGDRRRGNSNEELLDYIRAIEFETLLFFLGVLLLVGLMKELGFLGHVQALYSQLDPRLGNLMLGLLSAVIDNVPMMAAVLKSGIVMDASGWLSLTYAIGVGGSLLVIGSAAGIVTMSKIQGLSFSAYARYLAPLLLAFFVGYAGSIGVGLLYR